jgi:YD repeat-containing protein
MLCRSCGTSSRNDSQFCPSCGLTLEPSKEHSPFIRALLTISVLVIAAAVLGIFWGISKLKDAGLWPPVPTVAGIATPACQKALSIAQNSPEVRAALGEPIRESGAPTGTANRTRGAAFAEWTDELTGPKGKGHLCAVANRVGKRWTYSRLVFFPSAGGPAIDLTPAPELATPLALTDGKVYLVPLDLPAEYSLDWAPAYYKAKLGLDVKVLPAVPVDDWVTDATRNQAVAERLIQLMEQSERKLARDPDTILLGVTQRDMYIASLTWRYGVNCRNRGQRGVVSLARLRTRLPNSDESGTLLASRLQKVLTKNILLLAFHPPFSDDPSSILFDRSWPSDLDLMSENIIGGTGKWGSSGVDPTVTVTAAAGKRESWGIFSLRKPPPDISSEVFETDIQLGLFIQRRTDFYLDGQHPFQFVRVFRTKDDASRPFGVGGNDSLDIFLSGQMGQWIDLIDEVGTRVHFQRDLRAYEKIDQVYKTSEISNVFFNPRLEFTANIWQLRTSDGWSYVFPYRSDWLGPKVTILTGYSDSEGHQYAMTRTSNGDLASITTPSGYSLAFQHDSASRIQKITDSRGRSVEYFYDKLGRLIRFADSSGNQETYTYDAANHMLQILDGTGRLILQNEYEGDDVVKQTLSDGRQLKYRYTGRVGNTLSQGTFTDPNGFTTTFNFGKEGISQSLPELTAQ